MEGQLFEGPVAAGREVDLGAPLVDNDDIRTYVRVMAVTWREHYGTFNGMWDGTLVATVHWYDDGADRRIYWVASIVGEDDPGGDPLGLMLGLDHREWTSAEEAQKAAEEWLATHGRPSRDRRSAGSGGRRRAGS